MKRLTAVALTIVACSSQRQTTSTATTTASASASATPTATASASATASATIDLDAGADAPSDARPDAHSLACFIDMTVVEGEYCTEVRQDCLEWLEPPQGEVGRCKRFAPSRCVGPREHKRFCIDLDEFTRPGQKLPLAPISWTDAKRECEAIGKRLCLESEWNFACEGEAMLPYPTGYERPSDVCNFDQHKLLDARGAVRDLRVPSTSRPFCASPFGARNMVGNVDEWTFRDVMNGPNRTALKGGWWMAGRDRCRPATTAHGELYRDFQTGFRCCADGW